MFDKKIHTTKQGKRFIAMVASAAAVLILISMFFGMSYGWFVHNTSVEANSMRVAVAEGFSLIIGTSSTDLEAGKTEISMGAITRTLLPATASTTGTTRLRYVKNPTDVDPTTGLAKSGKTLTYADVTKSSSSKYYYDATFYIGAKNESFQYEKLMLEWDADYLFYRGELDAKVVSGVTYYSRTGNQFVEAETEIGEAAAGYYTKTQISDTQRAVKADVYLNNTYCGTLSLNNQTTQVELLSTPGTLGTTSPVKVTLRCYYDGAETYNGNVCVRDQSLNTGSVYLAVKATIIPQAE